MPKQAENNRKQELNLNWGSRQDAVLQFESSIKMNWKPKKLIAMEMSFLTRKLWMMASQSQKVKDVKYKGFKVLISI